MRIERIRKIKNIGTYENAGNGQMDKCSINKKR